MTTTMDTITLSRIEQAKKEFYKLISEKYAKKKEKDKKK